MLTFKFPPNQSNGFNNCEDAVISSVIYNESKYYEYLHSLYWGLLYWPPTPERPSINDRFFISGLFRLQESFIQELFGLEFVEHKAATLSQFISNLHKRLSENKAVILILDTYDLPWNIGYQNYHRKHYLIVTDFPTPNTLICHDPFCKIQHVELPFDLISSNTFHYFNYTVNPMEEPLYSGVELLQRMSNCFIEQKSGPNMQALAMELKDYNLYGDMEGIAFDSICLAPFFINLKGVVSSHLNILDFIQVLPQTYIKELRSTFVSFFNNWNIAYCVLIKSISLKGNKTYMLQAAELIYKTAVEEEAIANKIIELGAKYNG